MPETLPAAPAQQTPPEGFVVGMPGEDGFYVPVDLHDRVAVQNASIRAAGRIVPPKLHTQLNYMEDGRVIVGDYPEASTQAAIEARDALLDAPVATFQATVDQENLNTSYTQELKSVYDYFQSKRLPIDPLRVVSKEVAKKVYAITGQDPQEAEVNLGQHLNSRTLVIEDEDNVNTFGRDYILGIALHEAAHSVYPDRKMLRTVTEAPDRRVRLGGIATSGLIKADIRREAKTSTSGSFWNEAVADLTRVRALREMGRSNDMTEESKDVPVGDMTITVRPNAADRSELTAGPNTIIMPAEYTLAIVAPAKGKNTVGTSPCNYTAYALDLLDERAPGLYDDFLAAARDPKRQADAIRKIESIQPGLYRKLSDLEYNETDFVAGLGLVIDALGTTPLTE